MVQLKNPGECYKIEILKNIDLNLLKYTCLCNCILLLLLT